jgi:pyridoxamine 5'-phosphate oxidase
MVKYKDLSEKTIAADPFVQFDLWYREHSAAGAVIPESVSLATASAEGRVSVRTVLLKDYSANGFVFFTNYNSRKAKQISSNNNAALLFYWPESGRQVRIEGNTEKLPEEESTAYHKTRPRESQLSAWASNQSSVIPDRKYLEDQYKLYKKRFYRKSVDKPEYWGGFRIIPYWFEFWQNGKYRLHERISYSLKNNIWVIERLAP